MKSGRLGRRPRGGSKDKKWTHRQCWHCGQMAYWGRGHGCTTKGCKAAAGPMEIESEMEEGEVECDEGGGQEEAAEQLILERADRRRAEEELLEKLDKEKQRAQEQETQLKEAAWQELLRQLNQKAGQIDVQGGGQAAGQGEELQGGGQTAGQGCASQTSEGAGGDGSGAGNWTFACQLNKVWHQRWSVKSR